MGTDVGWGRVRAFRRCRALRGPGIPEGHQIAAALTIPITLVALAFLTAEPRATTPVGGKVQLVPIETSARPAPAQHSLAPLATDAFRNPTAVASAVEFIEDRQPAGTYVLTTSGSDDVVHMDVAHAALALTKAGRVDQARAALDWLLVRMTTSNSADRFAGSISDGPSAGLPVDYAGSWWDHLATSGDAKRWLTRGRAEGVGLTLVATHAVWRADPDYLDRLIATSGSDRRVIDRVALAAGYIGSAAIQHPDGRFNHRPDYAVSFAEEGARMVLGLRLAAEMLEADGREVQARVARDAAARGLAALRAGDDVNRGMSYDYYALGIWGLVSPADASAELAATRRAQLASRAGVRNWDWQIHNAEKPTDRLRFWIQSQAIAPSETFDWAIAAATAGDYASALEIERRWLSLQGSDGGFPAAYLPSVGLAFGEPTTHSAARFVMLERVLTDALGR